jgi:hypothetical protein
VRAQSSDAVLPHVPFSAVGDDLEPGELPCHFDPDLGSKRCS